MKEPTMGSAALRRSTEEEQCVIVLLTILLHRSQFPTEVSEEVVQGPGRQAVNFDLKHRPMSGQYETIESLAPIRRPAFSRLRSIQTMRSLFYAVVGNLFMDYLVHQNVLQTVRSGAQVLDYQ